MDPFGAVWRVPPSFVDPGPKLRVLIIAIGEWPKMAKKLCEPRKMTHSSETEFFWSGPNGKVVCPVDNNCDSKTKT